MWLAVLLLAIAGAYSAFWFVAASRIEGGLAQWAQTLKQDHLELTWQRVEVAGFPLLFDVALSEPRLRDLAEPSRGELRMPIVSASARPWNFYRWQLTAPSGLTARQGPEAGGGAALKAPSATGVVAASADGGASIWFALVRPAVDFGPRVAAQAASVWLILPPQQPQSHGESAFGVAVMAEQLALPAAPPPFKNPLDEVDFGLTVKGLLKAAPLRQSLAAWRDSGGTAELDHVHVHWGSVAVRGSGTVALDADLQPEGAFTAAVEGYDALLTALVEAGRMRTGDAQLAKLALSMMAKPGPGGRPEIATSFTIQDGEMFLGPARLGRVPRIVWQ
ncbi:MAG: DUF2125 domain-containing protein [Thiohalocapsa sp.]